MWPQILWLLGFHGHMRLKTKAVKPEEKGEKGDQDFIHTTIHKVPIKYMIKF